MNDKIQREWFDKFHACPLSKMERWKIEEEISDILFDKGYDFINFTIAPCRHGRFNAISCETQVASKLTHQIKDAGFHVITMKNPQHPSESWIIFPYNLTHELRGHVESFEVIT